MLFTKLRTMVLTLFLIVLYILMGCSSKDIDDIDEVLIEAAREHIPTDALNNTQIEILGFSSVDRRYLYWFSIGDEFYHTYLTIEFVGTKSGGLHSVSSFSPIDRGGDVASISWLEGYSFLVNSEKCKMIEIVTNRGREYINVYTTPFVYYVDYFPQSYRFLDGAMEEI